MRAAVNEQDPRGGALDARAQPAPAALQYASHAGLCHGVQEHAGQAVRLLDHQAAKADKERGGAWGGDRGRGGGEPHSHTGVWI